LAGSLSRFPFVLVTRPAEPGRRLAAGLRANGCDALWLPAFELLPPPAGSLAEVRECAAVVSRFDLVVFVSPAAVRAFAVHLAGAWPTGTAIAVTGSGTREALRESVGATEAKIFAPCGSAAADGGAEQLWSALAPACAGLRTALIVRAQSGREWLGERLRGAGVAVRELAAYRRQAHAPAPAERAALQAALGAGSALAILYSSSEAVAAVGGQLAQAGISPGWQARCLALCLHERIGQAAAAAGITRVRLCSADLPAVLAALAPGLP